MTNKLSWSVNAGRWMGVPVRVHMFVFLFVTLMFGLEWNHTEKMFTGTAMVSVFVLLGSILLHELAHVFAISNLGGHVNDIELVPWGGNSDFVLPQNPYAKLIVHLSGAFANAVLVMLGAALLIQTQDESLFRLINPFAPHLFETAAWELSLVKIVTWVNFQLMIVNLIPCYPFDGAKIVRAMIGVANLNIPKYRVETAIKLIGHMSAFAFIGMAWICKDYTADGLIEPTWLPLLLIGITLLFTARYSLNVETNSSEQDWDDMEDVDYGSIYSESAFFDFSESPDNTSYSQWLTEKQEARRELESIREEEEDRQADSILEKLHNGGGLSSLSDEEQAILRRVSERIRRRRQQGV